ncbi:MAG: hypothetical protein L0154_30425 [Chloroflexi bacterium]|nr:hypothetical protein [Chloroflexota bacterium]
MLGSAVLDTAIGIVFIFFVISTLCSSTFSFLARITSMRGRLLQQGLLHMLGDDIRAEIFNHPLVRDVSLTGTRWYDRFLRMFSGCRVQPGEGDGLVPNPCPAYIPPETFTRALLDLVVEAAEEKSLNSVFGKLQKAGLERLEEGAQIRIRLQLNRLLDQGEETALPFVEDLLNRIEERQPLPPDIRLRILDDVKSCCGERENIMAMIEEGIEEIALPVRTVDFLRRNIELLQRRRMRDTDFTVMANFEAFADTVTSWFNNSMDSLTNIFKVRAQVYLFFISTVIILFFNINAVVIAQTLWTQPTIRASIVESAQAAAADPSTVTPEDDERSPVEFFEEELAVLGLPIGWTDQELDAANIGFFPAQVSDPNREVPTRFINFFGWILTIGAAMFGAPFWYDVLNKIVNLRAEVKPEE